MNKWIVFGVLLMLTACKGEVEDIYFTPVRASQYFRQIEAICNEDNGTLWGENIYGPLMYVERSTRKIIANQPDNDGLLKLKNGIYTGIYPKELVISNTAITFGGTLFGMAPLPTTEDEYRIILRGLRCLFHRFQMTRGISSPGYNSPNIEEKRARIWLKLEWKALRKAIESEGEVQKLAIRDALIFRGTNHELYQKYVNDKICFENYEGLATFTSLMLATKSYEEYKSRLLENLDIIYSYHSYSRSYGFINGALYATLLYEKDFDFRKILSADKDIGDYVMKLYDIKLPDVCRDVAGCLSVDYGIDKIFDEENLREKKIQEHLNNQISTFIEKPVIYIDLESPYFDFEPEDIQPLGQEGTLYQQITISDDWGKLTVDKRGEGCLISNNLMFLRIPAKGYSNNKNHYEGDGWELILNNGWEIESVGENFFVRKF
jgi:hypothetical protein